MRLQALGVKVLEICVVHSECSLSVILRRNPPGKSRTSCPLISRVVGTPVLNPLSSPVHRGAETDWSPGSQEENLGIHE